MSSFILGVAGQENLSNSEGGALRLPEQLAGRRDSVSSLDSTMSSSLPASQTDLPEQYEVIKQQKDIIEHGIELWGPFQSLVVWMNTLSKSNFMVAFGEIIYMINHNIWFMIYGYTIIAILSSLVQCNSSSEKKHCILLSIID